MDATDVDPVSLEVVRNALVGIAEEAGAALRRTAYSPNIKERIDCSTALFDARARMVAQAEHIPVHLGSMPASVEAALAAFEDLAPGDQVLLSDPFQGGNHLPDWTVVCPVHAGDGRLLGYAANRAHHSDVGGAAPGSMPASATDIFAEGLRIPPVRLHRRGVEDEDVVAILLANTRTPRERLGDLRAQLGANALTVRRLGELADELGHESLHAAMAATLDHAERAMRAAIGELPDGTYRFADQLDDDGAGTAPVPIEVVVTIDGGAVTCDLTGSSPQVTGPVNAPRAVTVSAAVYALRAVAAPQAPANHGADRALTVITDPGSVVDPLPPAAVAAGNVETSQRVVDVLLGALAQAAPDRVPAASQGTMNNTLLGGTDPRSDTRFSYYETLGGGQGAGPARHGSSGIHTHMTNTRNTPVEAFELAYPVRVLEYRLRSGSGGAGRWRGGDGLRRVLEIESDDVTASLITERRVSAPWGRDGGGQGDRGRNLLVRDGVEEELPAKVTVPLRRGDRLVVETPGGGGFGPSDPPRPGPTGRERRGAASPGPSGPQPVDAAGWLTGRPPTHLEAGGLHLRPWTREDGAGLLVAVLESMEQLRAWMPWAVPAYGPADAAAFVEHAVTAREAGTEFLYAIVDAADDLVGACGLHPRTDVGGLEIGYWIHTADTGRGVATRAAAALTDAAFGLEEVTHVEIRHDQANERSGRVPRRLGFRRVATRASASLAERSTGVEVQWRLDRVDHPASPARRVARGHDPIPPS